MQWVTPSKIILHQLPVLFSGREASKLNTVFIEQELRELNPTRARDQIRADAGFTQFLAPEMYTAKYYAVYIFGPGIALITHRAASGRAGAFHAIPAQKLNITLRPETTKTQITLFHPF